LKDLNTLLLLRIGSLQGSSGPREDSVREVSKILYDVANDDCNFDTQRDADFALAVLNSWEDYKKYIRENPETLSELVSKHCDALSTLHAQIPRYVSRIKYDPGPGEYIEPEGSTRAEKSQFRHFDTLVSSVQKHLSLLDPDTNLRNDLVRDFQASTCNEKLTRQLFNLSFDPKSDKEIFDECLKP
jgi:hypothetical protein